MHPEKKNRIRLLILSGGFIISLGILFLAVIYGPNPSRIIVFPEAANLTTALNPNGDIEPQKPLANPPKIIKAIYSTSWSAGSERKISYFIDLIKNTELNAIVIDVKDYTGEVAYDTDSELVNKYGTKERRIPKINKLIKRFHDEGIYVIGRIAVFEDQKLPLIRPDLALQSKATGKLWKTNKGIFWLDTASPEVWEYNMAIARDMLLRGFDEINFDYVRFASDGDLSDIVYPIWNGKTPKREIIRRFHEYVRNSLPNAKISVDLFGMVTTNKDDLGIGQYLEDALPYYDAISPMVYPSHYITNFIGLKNPAAHPYEVVKYSLDEAIKRIVNYDFERESVIAQAAVINQLPHTILPPRHAVLRPWLQDFNLGAVYDANKIRDQIRATTDAALRCLKNSPANIGIVCDGLIHDEALGGLFDGWMLWNPRNIYTKGALK
jgi:hypothetical protein